MSTRDDILDAAAHIMRVDGFAKATTKQIARAAGYSEAALYKHFADKSEIFLGVLSERLPGLGRLLSEMTEQAGSGTVRANLCRITRATLDFYIESFPISVSVFSSQRLLRTHRARMRELGGGPRNVERALATYLRAEQRRGRISGTADPDAVAALLLGACFQQAFLVNFDGSLPDGEELDGLASALVDTLLSGTR